MRCSQPARVTLVQHGHDRCVGVEALLNRMTREALLSVAVLFRANAGNAFRNATTIFVWCFF